MQTINKEEQDKCAVKLALVAPVLSEIEHFHGDEIYNNILTGAIFGSEGMLENRRNFVLQDQPNELDAN